MKNFLIPIPPLPEQRAIADYLDRKCEEIDELISLQEKMIEELKAYKQSVITEAVTKGLNPDVPMKDSGIEWIGEIPSHWNKSFFKYFLNQITAPSFDDRKVALENIESGAGRYVPTFTEFEGNGISFSQGDIVYGKLRPYLRKAWLAEFSGNAIGDFYVFRPKYNVSAKYCKWLFLSNGFTEIVNQSTYGAKMPRVSIDFIKNLMFYLPPLSEQQSIADYLDNKCSEIDSLIALKQKKIEELKDYKKSIIYECVTGKIEIV